MKHLSFWKRIPFFGRGGCSSWLTQLWGSKFQWHWVLGWAVIWFGASALQGVMTHQMSHCSSWNRGNYSVPWLMLDFGTVAIQEGKGHDHGLGRSPKILGNSCSAHVSSPSLWGWPTSPSQNKMRTRRLYICVHTPHIHIYTHVYSELNRLSRAIGFQQSLNLFHLSFLVSLRYKHRFLRSMQPLCL